MKKYLMIIILIYSCTNSSSKQDATISEKRNSPNPKPVASYIVPMGDPKLDRKFGVEVFETPFTFKYLLSMQFDATTETDTLYLPQLDVQPLVVVKPGKDSLSCIIGFMDDKNIFREYKLLTGKNNQLRIKTLKAYYVTQ